MSPPPIRPIRIARDLCDSLGDFASAGDLGQVWPDGTPYVLDASPRRDWVRGARMPDVSFIARDRLAAHAAQHAEDGPFRLAPDLAVEIVFPGDSYTDINRKVSDYLRYGARLVWVIDPDERTIRIYTPDGRTLRDGDTLSGDPVLPGWSMPVRAVLDGPVS